MKKLIIQGRLPGLNEILKVSRSNRYMAAIQKKETDAIIMQYVKQSKLRPFRNKVDIIITWFCKNKRRDKDNIMAGQKFIFDALQKSGILKNDGWNEIGNISHKFQISEKEMVVVEFEENTES